MPFDKDLPRHLPNSRKPSFSRNTGDQIALRKSDQIMFKVTTETAKPPDRVLRRMLTLDPEVVKHFRATGPGWQTRINEALRTAAGLHVRLWRCHYWSENGLGRKGDEQFRRRSDPVTD